MPESAIQLDGREKPSMVLHSTEACILQDQPVRQDVQRGAIMVFLLQE